MTMNWRKDHPAGLKTVRKNRLRSLPICNRRANSAALLNFYNSIRKSLIYKQIYSFHQHMRIPHFAHGTGPNGEKLILQHPFC